MTAIKHTLQREVFRPDKERLIYVANVSKETKRKKTCFLCIAVTNDKPVQVTIYKVKKQEKPEGYKKKTSWPLRTIKLVDAKFNEKDASEFEIQADKTYKWLASSVAEKNLFIHNLWKLSQSYLVQKPEFINTHPAFFDENLLNSIENLNKKIKKNNEIETEEDDEEEEEEEEDVGMETRKKQWRGLTAKEQEDLEFIMSQTEEGITHAEHFSKQLSTELSLLDGANIHSIMSSEEQVLRLMTLIDGALEEVNDLDLKFKNYEQILENMKSKMDMMKDKDDLISIKNNNNKKLLDQLENLINKLSFDSAHIETLTNGDLSSHHGIRECTNAMKILIKAVNADIKPELLEMNAVKEQKGKLEKIKNDFVKRLSHQLNNLIIHQGNEMSVILSNTLAGNTLSPSNQGELRLPTHTLRYRQLLPYCDLLHCLLIVDYETYDKLKNVYTTNLSKLFEQQIKDFISSNKQLVANGYQAPSSVTASGFKRSSLIPSPGSGTLQRRNNSNASINSSYDDSRHSKSSQGFLDMNNDESGQYFLQIYEHMLCELEGMCVAEQDFCVKLFSLGGKDEEEEEIEKKAGKNKEGEKEEEGEGSPWVQSEINKDKGHQMNRKVRKIMGDIFASLYSELIQFEIFSTNLNNYNIIYMLERMSDHVLRTEDSGSYLSLTFGQCLIHCKRNFDKFIDSFISSIKEWKANKKTKIGIIQFVLKFEEFAKVAESVFKNHSRKADLDKAYLRLIQIIFEEVHRVACESQKIHPQVVQFENYHRLLSVLSSNKISSLESYKKEARVRYLKHLNQYTLQCLGQPLERLHQFFQAIESKLSTGMRCEDVPFQVAYSKQELKKILKEYPAKDVKKELEHLYKKIEKQLCEEENLLQVVWHSLQDEFIKQCNYFLHMISKCYSDSNLSLDFSIDDLLGFFSDIAQSH